MDCYLVEGYKIFYRIGFALLKSFVKFVKFGGSKWSGIIGSRGLQGAFMYFCQEIPVEPNNLLKKGFKIRGFSRESIEKTYLRTEIDLKARGVLPAMNSNPGGRRSSGDNLPTTDAMHRINAVSETLTYKDVSEPDFVLVEEGYTNPVCNRVTVKTSAWSSAFRRPQKFFKVQKRGDQSLKHVLRKKRRENNMQKLGINF